MKIRKHCHVCDLHMSLYLYVEIVKDTQQLFLFA